MSRTIYLPLDDYKKLCKEHSATEQKGTPDVSPEMKLITVAGKSGTGTPFKNEYDRLVHEHFNKTKVPVSLTLVEGDGMTVYMPENSDSTDILDVIEKELKKVNSMHYSYSSRQHARDIHKAIKKFLKEN